MASLGKWNTLKITRESEHGYYLDGGELGEILMPTRYIYDGCMVGETADVFLYADSEDRLIATTENAKGVAGEFAYLKCVAKNKIGAFMDIGLSKDLLIPFAEQNIRIEVDKYYLVRIYVDTLTNRLVGSCKLNKFLNDGSHQYFEDQEVDLVIAGKTDLGYRAIINHADWGLLYQNQVFQDLKIGQKIVGYIYLTREDGKIDLSLHKPAEKKVAALTEQILEQLRLKGGTLAVSDKSAPEEIYTLFHVSKKTFKKALGALYKERKICIKTNTISLIEE